MNIQLIIIAILFSGAVFYLGRLFYTSFYSKKNACGGNCGCSAIDLEKIEKEIMRQKNMRASK